MGAAPFSIDPDLVERLRGAVDRDRLLATAVDLVGIPSPTRSAGAVARRLAEILTADGFAVERHGAGWPEAPAVVARYFSGKPGPTLQFNGHLDTVHLEFVPPRVEDGILYGSGASDMKGGIASMVEGLRVLRETELLPAGDILLTAHDLHEAPWGDGSQLDALIDAGIVGDAALLPEYCAEELAVIGRGLGVFEVEIVRDGQPVHEVLGGIDQPSVIQAGAEVIRRLALLDEELSVRRDPLGGRESAFVGRASGGEIFNQAPTRFSLSGTRRWLPGADSAEVQASFLKLLDSTVAGRGVRVECKFQAVREAFQLDPDGPFATAFQSASRAVMGFPLPLGGKPFVDDGNSFTTRGGVPAITHGPAAHGAHTLKEWVPVDELERVAVVYATTAIAFCGGGPTNNDQ